MARPPLAVAGDELGSRAGGAQAGEAQRGRRPRLPDELGPVRRVGPSCPSFDSRRPHRPRHRRPAVRLPPVSLLRHLVREPPPLSPPSRAPLSFHPPPLLLSVSFHRPRATYYALASCDLVNLFGFSFSAEQLRGGEIAHLDGEVTRVQNSAHSWLFDVNFVRLLRLAGLVGVCTA